MPYFIEKKLDAMYDVSFKNKERRPLQEAVRSFLPWYSKHLGLNFPTSKKCAVKSMRVFFKGKMPDKNSFPL
jgi:hypothetical protein